MDHTKDIAIIGVSFEFPGANDLSLFFESLLNKDILYSLHKQTEKQTVNAWGGLSDPYGFDYSFFQYSYREASMMDPQHRLLLMHSWWSLENAGYAYNDRPVTGIFSSASINRYVHENLSGVVDWDEEDEILTGNIHDFLATKIAFKLNLKGPALNIQSGCSSALVAIHQARIALLTKQCDLAVVGAVSLSAPNESGYNYSKSGIRSNDGYVRPFDAQSSGTVFTNGVASIVLRRFDDAIKHSDRILGVIAGSALNNDGSQKASFVAPSARQQAQVIKKALRVAAVSPTQYAFLEAHGTGTDLGDPIEFLGLTDAFNSRQNKSTCALQSVKANIGHMDTVSGMAGVIKTALILSNKIIPPQINFHNANPKIELESSPFYINSEAVQINNKHAYAGITSLGIGGTNAHVVMRRHEAVVQNISKKDNDYFVVALSAHNEKTLTALKHGWKDFIRTSQNDISAISQNSLFSRDPMAVRTAFVGSCKAEIADEMNLEAVVTHNQKDLIFMFPGQGSQYFGMARGLTQCSSLFSEILQSHLNIVSQLLDKDCWAMIYHSKDTQELYDTVFTQPILVALEVALAKYLLAVGVRPKAMLGHSLGEYSALIVAGALDYEQAMPILIERAKLMSSTSAGAMIAVGSSIEVIEAIIPSSIDVAAVNTDELVTLSGNKSDIAKFKKLCMANGLSVFELPNEKAYHSHLMDPILADFQSVIAGIKMRECRIPVISNITGRYLNKKDLCDESYLVRHMRQTVNFHQSIRMLLKDKAPLFLEVGPGTTLSSLAANISALDGKRLSPLNMLPHPKESVNCMKTLLKCMAYLWVKKFPINWNKVQDYPQIYKKIALPKYPFQLEKCFIPKGKRSETKHGIGCYQKVWLPCDDAHSQTLDLDLYHIQTINSAEGIVQIIDEAQLHEAPTIIIYQCIGSNNHSIDLLKLAQSCILHDKLTKIERIYIVTHEAADFAVKVNPIVSCLQTQVKVLNQELAASQFKLIDMPYLDAWHKEVIKIIQADNNYPVILLRAGILYAEHYIYKDHKEAEIYEFGSTVIIGGTGNVGLEYTKAILANTKGKVFLLQKSLPETLTNPTTDRQRMKVQKMLPLKQYIDDRLFILSADIGDLASLERAINKASIINGKSIDSIIHAAGVDASMHYRLLKDVDVDFYNECFYAKVKGLDNLGELAEKLGVKHCHIVSSISSVLGGIGMFVYGGMHAYIDHFVIQQRQKGSSVKWSMIGWEAWDFQLDDSEPEHFQQGSFGDHLNELAMPLDVGQSLITKLYGRIFTDLYISSVDLNQRYKNWVLGHIDEVKNEGMSSKKIKRPSINVNYTAPDTMVERKLAAIWETLMGIEQIGVHDSFFELGGHSLLALQMLKMIKSEFNVSLSIVDLFEFSTIRKLTSLIEDTQLSKDFLSEAGTRYKQLRNKKQGRSKRIMEMEKR